MLAGCQGIILSILVPDIKTLRYDLITPPDFLQEIPVVTLYGMQCDIMSLLL